MAGKRRYTYADLEKVPEGMNGELLDGELFVSPRPSPPHAKAQTALTADVEGPFDRGRGGPGGWWILFEPEIRMYGNAVVPDVAGWRRERLPVPPQRGAFEVAPDWACEVLSPSNARLDIRYKKPFYAKLGIGHLWMVDPVQRTVEVFRLENERWSTIQVAAADEKVRPEPFDAVELDLATWWLPVPPPAI